MKSVVIDNTFDSKDEDPKNSHKLPARTLPGQQVQKRRSLHGKGLIRATTSAKKQDRHLVRYPC